MKPGFNSPWGHNMITENKFKEDLLNKLGQNWVDGDKENKNDKTADIVNHSLQIAIEIKDETKIRITKPFKTGKIIKTELQLKTISDSLLDHIRDTRKKFQNYQGYRTILLIRTENCINDLIPYCINGFHTFGAKGYIGQVQSKYTRHIKENIGGFLIYSYDDDGRLFYFLNDLCKNKGQKTTKDELEIIFNQKIEDINC